MHKGNLLFGLLIFKLFLWPMFIWGWILALGSYTWSSVEGQIVESKNTYKSVGNSYEDRVVITFEYQVEGQSYQSDIIKLAPRLYDGEQNYDTGYRNVYKKGRNVTVFYPSFRPSFGALERGITIETIYVSLGLLLVYLVGFWAKRKLPDAPET